MSAVARRRADRPRILPLRSVATGAAGRSSLFFALLIGLPLPSVAPARAWRMFDAFYRAGSLVFGGGHVVLPLLQAEVVPPGWVTNDAFWPATARRRRYPGRSSRSPPISALSCGRRRTAGLARRSCLVAVFLPSFLLVVGALPFWDAPQSAQRPGRARGVNAAVVGLLLAALYSPVWTAGHHQRARLRVSGSLHSSFSSCGKRRPGWW